MTTPKERMQGAVDGKATVLVVDDTPAQRYARSRQLAFAGFHVLEASTGFEALELAPLADAVLLDVLLPDMSGLDVCRALRLRPDTQRLAIVHVSAVYVSDIDRINGTEAGADAYLVDPVPPAVLNQVLASTMANRQHQGERLVDLQAISYTSTATRAPTEADMRSLLHGARRRNEHAGITGVLLYAEGTFHQYLEGPLAGLEVVYDAILADPRHRDIFEFIREPIDHREFARYFMAFQGTQDSPEIQGDHDLHALLSDESPRLSPGRLLLNAFWVKCLSRRPGVDRTAPAGDRRP
jgi:CheY-like chemotaxis protein